MQPKKYILILVLGNDPNVLQGRCSLAGFTGFFYNLATAWQRSLTHSDMTGEELYGRMEGMFAYLGQIGALVATMSFLAFQEGLGDNPQTSESRQV